MPCCILLSTRDRDVFVKTVVRAFQRLDSVPLEIDARTMSLVCQEMFTTREECLRRNPRIQSVPVFFSAITPGSTSAKRQSGLSANSASRKLGARLCVSAQSLVRSGRNVISNVLRIEDIHGELGEVLAGTVPGRRSSEEITIAKFVGIGVQDLAAAEVSIEKLKRAGQDLPFLLADDPGVGMRRSTLQCGG
jgi:Ornithine cyclodeaminase/mu-crystallin family